MSICFEDVRRSAWITYLDVWCVCNCKRIKDRFYNFRANNNTTHFVTVLGFYLKMVDKI